jgi:hypothetical protein
MFFVSNISIPRRMDPTPNPIGSISDFATRIPIESDIRFIDLGTVELLNVEDETLCPEE